MKKYKVDSLSKYLALIEKIIFQISFTEDKMNHIFLFKQVDLDLIVAVGILI